MNRIARPILMALVALSTPVVDAVMCAQGTSRPTVAVLPFTNSVGTRDAREYDGLGKALPDFLIAELATNPAIHVLMRDQVQKLLDAQRLVAPGPIDRETAVKVGRLLGAQHMIFGGFMTDAHGNFRIDARVVNVESSLIEFTDRGQDKADDVMALVAKVAGRLTAGLKLPGTPMRAADVAPPVRLPMRSAVMYGKALDLADKGEHARAAELFGAVLKEFPGFEPARAEANKLKPKG